MNLSVLMAATAKAAAKAPIQSSDIQLDGVSGALVLMAIGMLTVFIVLILVMYMGHLLIYVVNKYAPEEEKAVKSNDNAPATGIVDALTTEAINKAVAQMTGGKGKVESIQKL